ncbi:hypothetical protein MPLA_530001 [Mesorhizobium sp. ORS 3359]|nr:hypothetical protein MPLA_530001 [Mesorhizobium sp. ORS 3359]
MTSKRCHGAEFCSVAGLLRDGASLLLRPGMTIAMGISANLQGVSRANANRADRSKSLCSATSPTHLETAVAL